MKPVFQTRYGKEGNCLASCIASILEVPLERVDFEHNVEDWVDAVNKVLMPLGFYYLGIDIKDGDISHLLKLDGVWAIFSGVPKRNATTGMMHAVVGIIEAQGLRLRFNTIHDPYEPDQCGFEGMPKDIGFLVPRNPHHFTKP